MLGLINFTHSDPLYAAYPNKENVARDTPKLLLKKLKSGEIGCGMISLMEYFENMDIFDLVESATIHSLRGTMSTLLISASNRISRKMNISITEHTKTTAVYLELILKKLGIDYSFKWSDERDADKLLEEAEYALVIGDEAIKVYNTRLKIIWDVGYQFSRMFSMSPVFSVTVKRKHSNCESEVAELDTAITESQKHIKECVAPAAEKLMVGEEIMRRYFETIKYNFTPGVQRTVNFLLKTGMR